ncbi:MAG: hypothetical protein IJ626_04330 [Muribaculaceae bacterium]|nr:hypothetical protein [Muribaculaceae bacterium]
MADSGVILVPTSSDHDISMFVPTLIYNEDSQEFTIDFGEVDEISSGRVVIHDDSGGYQVKNFLVTPACHEFTFTCPLQGTLCITITTPHGDTYGEQIQ